MFMILKSVKKTLGERNVGRFEYFLKRRSADSWGGPFNGQKYRQKIYLELFEKLRFESIVETGTFRGTTTLFMAQSGASIYTVEANPRNYGFAAMRLLQHRNSIHLYEGDSRGFLTQLAKDATFPKSNVFFYLDAHWKDDLPLKEELQIIFSAWREAVVMVDDFKVPDSSYTYDDYGPGKTLNLEYLEAVRQKLQLYTFFPSVKPELETGSKRGCIVLTDNDIVKNTINGIELLYEYKTI
jgi:predicted O-methyltransferase YrrM